MSKSYLSKITGSRSRKDKGTQVLPKGTSRHSTKRVLKAVLLVFLFTAIICLGSFLYYVIFYLEPSIDINIEDFKLNHTSFVYYYDSSTNEPKVQEELYSGENRVWANLDEIPDYMQKAAIAIEDQRFMQHHGVDWKRTIGATLNLFSSNGYGGSTITQQLVKNLTGDEEVSITRKFQEILRALDLEKKYSKEEILEFYLNVAFFGRNCNGVQAAANTYFDKDVSQLTLAEAASIVGITKYPGKYDPFTHPDNNKERQETVLYKMYEQGYITKEQYEKAKAEPLNFAKEKATSEVNSKQSYFTDQVIEDVINSLVTEKGYTKQFATSMVYSGGLKIYSTMNKDIQDTMDTVFKDEKNFPKTYGSKQKAQASMTVMDPYTGAVVGIVGGRGEKTVDRGLNRATQTTRSPGSTIKPIAVYAPAIEYNVITEGSVFDDTPLDIADKWPKNYTNKYGGMTTVKDAVEQSINTIATKVLDKLGTERSYNFMKNNLGITSLVDRRVQNGQVKSDINLSPLGLGGLTDGVSVMELTAAYVPFANKGIYVKPYTFTKVEDYQGNVILEKKPEKSIAMSEQTAYIMNDLLQSVVSYGTGTPAKLSGMPTAGKTGTTSDDKDRWFVGYTPYYVGAVWFGFDTPEEINVSGNNPALVLWKRVMSKIHEGKQSRDFYSTQGLTRETVCADSGLLMTDACKSDPRGSREYTAWFKKGTVPTKYCDVHIFADIDTETNMIAGANCPASNRKKVGLLNVKREFPYDIGVTDAQYTYLPIPSGYSYSYNGPVYQNLLPDGTFAGHSEGVDNPMNHLSPGSSATPDNESSDSGAASQTETPSDSGTQSGNTGTATQNDTTTAPSNNSNDNSSSGNSGATKTEEPVVPVVN